MRGAALAANGLMTTLSGLDNAPSRATLNEKTLRSGSCFVAR
jgi:hypothetical protein